MERKHRGDVDDLAGGLGSEAITDERLTEEKHSVDVDTHNVVPVFLGELIKVFAADDPRAIDEDIEGSETFLRGLNQRRNGRAFAEVGGDREALAPESFDLFAGVFGREDIDGHDVGPGFGERECHALTEAARGTRDNGGFPIEFETIEDRVHDWLVDGAWVGKRTVN